MWKADKHWWSPISTAYCPIKLHYCTNIVYLRGCGENHVDHFLPVVVIRVLDLVEGERLSTRQWTIQPRFHKSCPVVFQKEVATLVILLKRQKTSVRDLPLCPTLVKVEVGVSRPIQQPGSYWDGSSAFPLVGLEPTQKWQPVIRWQTC